MSLGKYRKGKVKMDGKTDKKNEYRCPLCGGSISELPKFYGCDNFRKGCGYKIFKTHFGIVLTEKNLDDLLTKGVTDDKVGGFFDRKSKSEFAARLRYDAGSGKLRWVRPEDP